MQGLGVLLILISATCFGAMPIFAHFAYAAGTTPLTVLFIRFAVAAVCFSATSILSKIPLPNPQNMPMLMLVGGVGLVLQSLSFFTALTIASPGLVVLLLHLYPAIVTGISITVLHQPRSTAKLCALGMALFGTVLTVGPIGSASLEGASLALLAAFLYAIQVLLVDQVLKETFPVVACAVMMTVSAFSCGTILTIQGAAWPTEWVGWFSVSALTLVSTVLGIGAFLAGIKRLGASTAAMLSTLEPLVTVLLSAVILNQLMTGTQIIGGGLILTAVLLLSVQP